MKQTQRSSTAARTRGLVQSETLENRRLFAGMPFNHGNYGHGGFGPPHGAGRFRAEAAIISLPLGGQMRLTSNGVSTTATSSSAGAAITAIIAAAASGTASFDAAAFNTTAFNTAAFNTAGLNTVAFDTAPVAVPVTVPTTVATRAAAIAVTNQDAPAADAINGDFVRQVMADRAPAAAATRSSAAVRSIDATTSAMDNGTMDNGTVFGPFTLGPAAAPAARPMEDGLGSLLTLNPDALDRSLRWQSQDATYRPRRPVSPTATAEDLPVDLANAAATTTVEQAGLAPVAAEMATRPLWQRVAAIAAGGLLVAANVVVRRRRAHQAGTVARR